MSLLGALLASLLVHQEALEPVPEAPPVVVLKDAPPIGDAEPVDEEAAIASDWVEARPALWKMEDDDTTIYLFGTVHLLPYKIDFFSEELMDAMNASDQLVTETQRSWTMSAWMGSMAKAAFDPGQPPIKQRIDIEHHELLGRAIEESGLPESFFDKIRTWAAAGFVDSLVEEEALETAITSAEEELETYFRVTEKSHDWLESWREQVELFSKIDEPTSVIMLENALRDYDLGAQRYEPLVKRWSDGDVEGLTAMVKNGDLIPLGLRETLLYQRNRNWVEWINARMDEPGTVFLAVGAGHMVGEKSVIDYLEKAGWEITRVQ